MYNQEFKLVYCARCDRRLTSTTTTATRSTKADPPPMASQMKFLLKKLGVGATSTYMSPSLQRSISKRREEDGRGGGNDEERNWSGVEITLQLVDICLPVLHRQKQRHLWELLVLEDQKGMRKQMWGRGNGRREKTLRFKMDFVRERKRTCFVKLESMSPNTVTFVRVMLPLTWRYNMRKTSNQNQQGCRRKTWKSKKNTTYQHRRCSIETSLGDENCSTGLFIISFLITISPAFHFFSLTSVSPAPLSSPSQTYH